MEGQIFANAANVESKRAEVNVTLQPGPPEVPFQTTVVSDRLSALEESVGALKDRLAPVLRDEPPSEPSDDAELIPFSCPHAIELWGFEQRIRRIESNLDRIHARLAL